MKRLRTSYSCVDRLSRPHCVTDSKGLYRNREDCEKECKTLPTALTNFIGSYLTLQETQAFTETNRELKQTLKPLVKQQTEGSVLVTLLKNQNYKQVADLWKQNPTYGFREADEVLSYLADHPQVIPFSVFKRLENAGFFRQLTLDQIIRILFNVDFHQVEWYELNVETMTRPIDQRIKFFVVLLAKRQPVIVLNEQSHELLGGFVTKLIEHWSSENLEVMFQTGLFQHIYWVFPRPISFVLADNYLELLQNYDLLTQQRFLDTMIDDEKNPDDSYQVFMKYFKTFEPILEDEWLETIVNLEILYPRLGFISARSKYRLFESLAEERMPTFFDSPIQNWIDQVLPYFYNERKEGKIECETYTLEDHDYCQVSIPFAHPTAFNHIIKPAIREQLMLDIERVGAYHYRLSEPEMNFQPVAEQQDDDLAQLFGDND